MPEVAFHAELADRTGYACRLLRKALRRGARVRVVGEAAEIDRLDVALWTFEAQDFVPHVRLREGLGAAALRAPIWLQEPDRPWPQSLPAPDVVVNLGPQPVSDPGSAARIIELVGTDPSQRQAGRERWRHYQAAGLSPAAVSAAQAG